MLLQFAPNALFSFLPFPLWRIFVGLIVSDGWELRRLCPLCRNYQEINFIKWIFRAQTGCCDRGWEFTEIACDCSSLLCLSHSVVSSLPLKCCGSMLPVSLVRSFKIPPSPCLAAQWAMPEMTDICQASCQAQLEILGVPPSGHLHMELNFFFFFFAIISLTWTVRLVVVKMLG